jgi:acetyl-CoA C-acetyltransferase
MALQFNRLHSNDVDFAELYSCFPCIPKLARRALAWLIEKPMSVAGGLTFAGGPVGNYMSHAIAAMTERLRREGGVGLLFGNGGFANTNHCIALTREPLSDAALPRSFDVQAEADAQRGAPPDLVEDYAGAGRVETFTVFYNREGGPHFGVVVGRGLDGARFLARVDGADAETIEQLTNGATEPVGAKGASVRHADGLNHWRFT